MLSGNNSRVDDEADAVILSSVGFQVGLPHIVGNGAVLITDAARTCVPVVVVGVL